MNLLIIDDEITNIRYLTSQTNWTALGISQVYEAQSVAQAKELLTSHTIEILLCDIEMPSGSGLELIEWVRSQHYPSVNIFITCHDEFKFAQKAISLGAFSYLLKPVDISELSSVIEQAILKYRESELLSQMKLTDSQTSGGSLSMSSEDNIPEISLPNMNSYLVMLMKGDFDSMQLLTSSWERHNTKNGKISKRALSSFRLVYEEMIFRTAREYSINVQELLSQEIFQKIPEPLASISSFHQYLRLLAVSLYEKIQEQLTAVPVINKVKQYIREHYMEEISMNEIAAHVNMNKDYLVRIYKQHENGSSPVKDLLSYRLEQSKKLLAVPDFSISEIAAMTGFNSQSYFCKIFKQQLGCSPKEYRKNLRYRLL